MVHIHDAQSECSKTLLTNNTKTQHSHLAVLCVFCVVLHLTPAFVYKVLQQWWSDSFKFQFNHECDIRSAGGPVGVWVMLVPASGGVNGEWVQPSSWFCFGPWIELNRNRIVIFVWYRQTLHHHPNKYIRCCITPPLYYCETLHYTRWSSMTPVRVQARRLHKSRGSSSSCPVPEDSAARCGFGSGDIKTSLTSSAPCSPPAVICVRRRWFWGSMEVRWRQLIPGLLRYSSTHWKGLAPTGQSAVLCSDRVQWTIVPVHSSCSPARWTLLWTCVNGALSQWLRQKKTSENAPQKKQNRCLSAAEKNTQSGNSSHHSRTAAWVIKLQTNYGR